MRTPVRYRWVVEPVAQPARGSTSNGNGTWTPPVDVYETEAAWVVEMDLPGVPPESVELVLEQGDLVVSGERSRSAGGALRLERPAGPFRRAIRLGDGAAGDRTRATTANGVLRIEVPKVEQAKPRRIPVSATEPAAV